MKIFVTGASGFIGSHLCEALRDAGHDVTGLASHHSIDSFGWLDEVDGIEKVRGDIRDADHMRTLVRGHGVVYHLAALISIPDSYQRPRSYVDTNVTGTLNMLMAAREAGCKFIHTSTSEVYGTAQYTPMDEKHPIHPQSPYAASKAAADYLVQSFALSYAMETVTIRPFNTYGPRQSERAVIARIIAQLFSKSPTIDLGNLEAKRDFTFVTDTAQAFISALNLDYGIYNVGSGQSISIGDLAKHLLDSPYVKMHRQATGKMREKKIRSMQAVMRPSSSEVDELLCNAVRFQDATGWQPEIELDQGLNETVRWWSNEGLSQRKQEAELVI